MNLEKFNPIKSLVRAVAIFLIRSLKWVSIHLTHGNKLHEII